MTKNQARLLRFLLKYPYSLHTVAGDSVVTALSLEKYGLVTYNSETKQVQLNIVRPTEDK